MTTNLTEAEILAFLHAVESGEVALAPVDNPQEIYTGEVIYFASNRWSITVRIEDNAWHHIDGLSTADGRECIYQQGRQPPHIFETYYPSVVVEWIRYGLPGRGCFRCVECGEDLLDDDYVHRPEFHCIECGPYYSHLSDSDISRLLG